MTPLVSLRPAAPADEPFLFTVYASTRRDELAGVDWTPAQTQAFLRMQHDAQLAAYRARHPRGAFLVVQLDGQPVGRLFFALLDGHLRIIDLALLPEVRGAGIGTSLLEAILAGANAAGMPVSLHVERGNGALRLYERLGFVHAGGDDVYLLLEHDPPSRSVQRARAQLNTAS